MILATTETLPGQPFVVITLVVAAIPYFGTKYGEGIGDLKGNTAPDVPAVLEARRLQCIARLEAAAAAIEADAVVGVRLDHREITDTWKELCAYGTAVRFTAPTGRQAARR